MSESSRNDLVDISIPLRFDGAQPNAFGAAPATAIVLGDTRTGSSVNYAQYTLTPHCNGTHTECVGHITTERIYIRDCLRDVLMSAFLISVEPELKGGGDLIITADALRQANVEAGAGSDALIVRTLPNDESKLERRYSSDTRPAYFSESAIESILIYGFTHMLTDLPSIDRIDDGGKLLNHKMFWGFDATSNTYAASRMYSTVTEMIYVPSNVQDGRYTLNLQIAPFQADAAPSRPILMPA